MLFSPSGRGRKRQKKGEKGRFRPLSGRGGQTPLKPPFVTPPFAAAQFAICDCDAHRGPQKSLRFPRQEKAMLHCDLRVRWKVASDLRFRAAISEPETLFFRRVSGDLALSTQKSLAIAIVQFWCAKLLCPQLELGVDQPSHRQIGQV